MSYNNNNNSNPYNALHKHHNYMLKNEVSANRLLPHNRAQLANAASSTMTALQKEYLSGARKMGADDPMRIAASQLFLTEWARQLPFSPPGFRSLPIPFVRDLAFLTSSNWKATVTRRGLLNNKRAAPRPSTPSPSPTRASPRISPSPNNRKTPSPAALRQQKQKRSLGELMRRMLPKRQAKLS